jgi:hypothetical protein
VDLREADDIKAKALIAQMKSQASRRAKWGQSRTRRRRRPACLCISRAIFGNEGGLNPDGSARISSTGASCTGQLLWGTAIDMGVKNPCDPTQNAQGATKYMAKMSAMFGGDPTRSRAVIMPDWAIFQKTSRSRATNGARTWTISSPGARPT